MRYVAIANPKAVSWDWDDRPHGASLTVYEAESGPEFTGLLDSNGTPLYRVDERPRMGFCTERVMKKRKGSKRC